MDTTQDHVGTPCTYVDTRGKPYAALITSVHGTCCVNLVYVNDNEEQRDSYGRKLLRSSSCVHSSVQQAWGNYYLLPGETRGPEKQVVDSAIAP